MSNNQERVEVRNVIRDYKHWLGVVGELLEVATPNENTPEYFIEREDSILAESDCFFQVLCRGDLNYNNRK